MPDSSTQAFSEEAKANAKSDLDYIEQLKGSHAFQRYFLRRLKQKISEKEAEILSPTTADADISKKRAELAVLREIAGITAFDETGCRNILGLQSDELPCT